MRKLHFNTRDYSEPIFLITYNDVFQNGILLYQKKEKKLIWASVMHKNFNMSGNQERAVDWSISIVIPQPDFHIDLQKTKIQVDNRIYVIKEINYNFIQKGTIQLVCQFEKNFDDDTTKTFNHKLEFKLYG